MEQLLAKAYDKFSIELKSVQILFSGPSKLRTAPQDHVMGPFENGGFCRRELARSSERALISLACAAKNWIETADRESEH